MKNKLDNLRLLLLEGDHDVICITETWLDDSITDTLLINSCAYSIFRCDRKDRSGGGVCILVKNCLRVLPVISVHTSDNLSSVEIVVIDIVGHGGKLRLMGAYLNCNCSDDHVTFFRDCVETHMNCSPSVIVGDFNMPNINWSCLKNVGGTSKQEKFLDAVTNMGLTQYVDFPTHEKGNILDLVFGDQNGLVSNVYIGEPFS